MQTRKSIAAAAVLGALFASTASADIPLGVVKQIQPQPDRGGVAIQPDMQASLLQGVVTEVNAAAGVVEIQRRKYRVVPGSTQVIRSGQTASINAISKGQSLRFTVLVAKSGDQILGVVYVP